MSGKYLLDGGYGQLFEHGSDTKLVIKKTNIFMPNNASLIQPNLLECVFLTLFSNIHHGICKMKSITIDTKAQKYNITLKKANCDLQDYVINTGIWRRRRLFLPFLFQIVDTIYFLSKYGLIHGDIKPMNILCDEESIQLCDFGAILSFRVTNNFTNLCTFNYKPPESLFDNENNSIIWYDSKFDIWSLGMVCYYYFSGLNYITSHDVKTPNDEMMTKIKKRYTNPKIIELKRQFKETLIIKLQRLFTLLADYGIISNQPLIEKKLSMELSKYVTITNIKQMIIKTINKFNVSHSIELAQFEHEVVFDKKKIVTKDKIWRRLTSIHNISLHHITRPRPLQCHETIHCCKISPDKFEKNLLLMMNKNSSVDSVVIPEEHVDIIDRMTKIDPSKRISIEELRNHEIFKDIDKIMYIPIDLEIHYNREKAKKYKQNNVESRRHMVNFLYDMCDHFDILNCFVLTVRLVDKYYCDQEILIDNIYLICSCMLTIVTTLISNKILSFGSVYSCVSVFFKKITNSDIINTTIGLINFFNFKLYYETFDWILQKNEYILDYYKIRELVGEIEIFNKHNDYFVESYVSPV